MKIAVVGTGYVGLVTGTCFAELGVDVVCVDTDSEKIERLQRGIIPIWEPNLELLVEKNHKAGRLSFTTSLAEVLGDADIVFIAVGTPPGEDGSADLSHVLAVARTIGRHISKYLLVVTKSTVPVGTSELVRQAIREEQHKRRTEHPFDIASNPEFLKEGNAIEDFMRPDRVVVGTDSPKAVELMTKLYKPLLLSNFRVIFMDIASAEMAKYAANAMLATRISFMNDIAALCAATGADVNMVRKGIGTDTRIGGKFLYPGCGYGGSCFPKDVRALIRTASDHDCRMEVLEAVERVNNRQKEILFKLLSKHLGGHEALNGKQIAVWGLAFKPGTDDIREAPAMTLIGQLAKAGATITVYDPVATGNARCVLGDSVRYAADAYDAVHGADALVLVTEWKEFRIPDWEAIARAMKGRLIIDGRNVFDRDELTRLGFIYQGIGI